MMKLKLIILGIMLNFIAAYPFDPMGVPPAITSITNVTSTGFVVNWSSGYILGLNSNEYYLNYIVSAGSKDIKTSGNAASFSGLEPSTNYVITIETYAVIFAPISNVYFQRVMSSVTTAEEPIPEIKQVSTDYTQQSAKTVILKAKSKIILANGFHYKAEGNKYLVTQLSANTKSSDAVVYDILDPDISYLEIDKQNINLNSGSVFPDYEILQPQQGSLLVRNKNFDYNAIVKPGYYEIIEMNSGKLSKKGNLSGNETQIDVSDLKAGFYIVKIADGKQMYTQKIMIRY